MRNIGFIFFSLFIAFAAGAQDIYLKKNRFFTELVIAGAAENIKDVKKGERTITLSFAKNLSAGFSGRLDDRFISKITVKGDSLILDFAPDTDFTFMTEGVDAKIVASRKKKADDIKLGYGIEDALIKKGSGIIENAEADRQLGIADELMAKGAHEQAAVALEGLLASDINAYYRQEALFRLGNAYYEMGAKSYKNYITASQIYDDFTNLYPDSYLFRDALVRSADSKEKADMYYEAIFAHEKIIRLVQNEKIQKNSYKKIADIYQTLGQTDRAIEARESYLRRFKDDRDPQTAIIGMLYSDKGDIDTAFRYFQGLTGRKIDYSAFTPDSLYAMGEVFDKRGRTEEALNAFRRVYGFYPSFEKADMAMYRAAQMYEKMSNRKAAEALLLETVKKHPKEPGGMLSSIKYADTHLSEKNTQDWEKFLAPALASKDFEILEQADLVIIKSLFNEKNHDKTLERIDRFGKRSYSSPLMTTVYDIKQRIRLQQARQAYDETRFDQAQDYVGMLLKEFPDSSYRREAKTISQNVSFGKTEARYNGGDYKGVIDFIENFLTDETEVIEPAKWERLLDNAYYNMVKKDFDAARVNQALVNAKQYIAQFGSDGVHIRDITNMAERLILTVLRRRFEENKFLEVIKAYSDNQQIIDSSAQQPFRDTVKAYAAFSLYKMSMPDKAAELLSSVGATKTPVYWLTSLLLGNGQINFQVNSLDAETLIFLADEAEKKNPDTAVRLLNEYTKDPALAARQKFKISKNISDDAKREQLLVRIYQDVNSDPKKRFEGYEEVSLDMGILYYKKNSFRPAVEALGVFLKNYPPRDEKRAEGLYYMGKSYIKLKDNDNAVKNYIELLESVPGSVYASAARSELEEIQWRKSLTN
ncbi:MAG: tetratricopeptide repeat protein [Deferribacterales bacterium]